MSESVQKHLIKHKCASNLVTRVYYNKNCKKSNNFNQKLKISIKNRGGTDRNEPYSRF